MINRQFMADYAKRVERARSWRDLMIQIFNETSVFALAMLSAHVISKYPEYNVYLLMAALAHVFIIFPIANFTYHGKLISLYSLTINRVALYCMWTMRGFVKYLAMILVGITSQHYGILLPVLAITIIDAVLKNIYSWQVTDYGDYTRREMVSLKYRINRVPRFAAFYPL